MSTYRPGDEPFTIKLPPGFDTSRLFKFNPGDCSDCEYKAIGTCYSGGQSGAYCSVHQEAVQMRVMGFSE